jgi:hypothetical protein
MFARSCFGALSLALLSAAPLEARPVTPEQLMRHIRILASDEYEGRQPGTRGGERTEAYMQKAFADAGLVPGGDGGSWRQIVRLVRRAPISSSVSIVRRGRRTSLPLDGLVLLGREPLVRLENMPLLFAGHGLPANVEGANLRGHIVLILADAAPGSKAGLTERRAALAAAGAEAVIAIAPENLRWSELRRELTASSLRRAGAMPRLEGMISADAARDLFRAAGFRPEHFSRNAAGPAFRAHRLDAAASMEARSNVHAFETANIVGLVRGGEVPSQGVVVTAHWDHLGICRPEGAPDRICNGAVDNASGSAVLIETARAVAAGPKPARSIYFVATTAEEGGLHGASAFAEAPPSALSKMVAVLNIDTIALADKGRPVAIIGRGRYPALDRVIDNTARSLGREVDGDEEANIMVERQDGWAFARRGVPAVMATGSVSDMNVLRAYLGTHYHGPGDDLAQDIPLGGAAEDADLHIALARALADPARYPAP